MARRAIPSKGSRPQELISFLDKEIFNHEAAPRLREFGKDERCRLMFQGFQWLEQDPGTPSQDPLHAAFWRPIQVDENNWRPMPTQNELVSPVQNEVARLVGTGSKPYARPDDDTPSLVRGARKTTDVLLDLQDKLHFGDLDYELCHQATVYGTSVFKSFLDTDRRVTTTLPVPGALKCPQCDFVSATRSLPPDNPKVNELLATRPQAFQTFGVANPTNPFMPENRKIMAAGCPTCDEPHPLQPYTPEPREANSRQDFLGRPLGEEVPLNEVGLKVLSPYNYWMENHGFGITPSNRAREHADEQILSLEDIRAHYENGWEVQAEAPSSLTRWHPVLGASAFSGMNDSNCYQNHAAVQSFHTEPFLEKDPVTGVIKKNRGRSIIRAGQVVLLDSDFMIERKGKPGKFVRRVVYSPFQWEIRDGEGYGIGGVELVLSQQRNINTRKSQVIAARHRHGSPKLLAEEGMDLEFAGFSDTGYDSDIWYYNPGPGGEKPTEFGNRQMTGQWVVEEEKDIEALNRTFGSMEVEVGDLSNLSGVTAASAIMYAGEKASERRKARKSRLRTAKRETLQHLIELVQEYYREDRLYQTRGRNDKYAVRAFKGADFSDQVNIVIDEEPLQDDKLLRAAAIKDGLQAGTVVADTASAKRKINRAWGVPLDINDDQNLQVERAEEEWMAYQQDGRVPAVSWRSDSHVIHGQQHEIDWNSEECKLLRDECRFEEVELALEGWQFDYAAIEQAEAMFRVQPPPPQPPQAVSQGVDPLTGGPLPVSPEQQQQAVQQWQAQTEMYQKIQALPKALELRFYQLWQGILRKAKPEIIGGDPPPPQPGMDPAMVAAMPPVPPPPVDEKRAVLVLKLLRWRSHIESHYRQASQDATAAQAGLQIPSPAGAPSTPTGMMPAPNTETTPGPGSGPGATTSAGDGVAA